MPYDATTKDGIELLNIPDDWAQNDPRLVQMANDRRRERAQSQAKARQATPEYQAKLAAQVEADRKQYSPLNDMSGLDKVRANLGAGMSNIGTGLADVATDLFGSKEQRATNEADILEKRALDKSLAEGTTGGGALQFAGEVLPSMLIPGGAAMRGGKIFKSALQGAGAGAAQGAAQATAGDESRMLNTTVGAGFGAVLPGAVAGVKKGWAALNPWSGGERAAARAAQEAVQGQGGSLVQGAADLGLHNPNAPGKLPLSSAEVLQNTKLAQLERESRMNPATRPGWSELDTSKAQGAWRGVQGATKEAGELDELITKRGERWDTNWQKMSGAVRPQKFGAAMNDLAQYLDNAQFSPEALADDQVASAISHVQGSLAKAGDKLTPEHVQKLRAMLNGDASLRPNASILSKVDRSARPIQELKSKLDEALNSSTGGRWQRVLDDYADDSTRVDAAKAAQSVRDKFIEPSSGAIVGEASKFATDIPNVTPSRVTTALGGARRGRESLLSDQAVNELTGLRQQLDKGGIVQGVGRTGNAGPGTTTAGDLALQAGGQAAGKRVLPSEMYPIAGKIYEVTKQRAERLQSERLAQGLRDPDAMVKLLEMKLQSGQTLSFAEDNLYRALTRSANQLGAGLQQRASQ